jgi:hypothetical protein
VNGAFGTGLSLRRLIARGLSALERRLFGLTAADIRYTIEDVRNELHASHAELKAEIADLRREIERAQGRRAPEGVATASKRDPATDA